MHLADTFIQSDYCIQVTLCIWSGHAFLGITPMILMLLVPFIRMGIQRWKYSMVGHSLWK